MVTEIRSAGEALDEAAARLLAGEVVALPTETVYGLAGDATNGEAVARIFEVKGRPRFNPLIAHVASVEMAERLAEVGPLATRLAEMFWPGPLTLVLPWRAAGGVHPLVTAGLDTIALRMPRGFARDLIARLGRPLAAPSANRSGRVSTTSAQAVAEQLGGRIGLIVDGGATPVGVESTIVRVEPRRLTLLRPGGLTADEIEQAAGMRLSRASDGRIVAPGMLASHYAPSARMRLNATEVLPGEGLLAFGPTRLPGAPGARAAVNLSPSGDLREAAARLFSALAELDRSGIEVIAVEPVPESGLGEAINDRLARAAAPREEASDR